MKVISGGVAEAGPILRAFHHCRGLCNTIKVISGGVAKAGPILKAFHPCRG